MIEGHLFYATLNLHSNRKGKFDHLEFSKEVEPFIIRKNVYKKTGEDVNYFANAADTLGIIFFHFPDQKTMIDMEEHMNDHVKIILQEDL